MKDLPADIPARLVIAAVPEREDPRDALLVRADVAARSVEELPRGARVGTSSLRRVCLLHTLRSDLDVVMLRGNVDTRLRKLDEGQLEAIVLACAGLRRLGFADRITTPLGPPTWLPAIGQGALAIECRADDDATRARLALLAHAPTTIATEAERAFLARLEGGCRTPMAAHAILDGDTLRVEGLVGSPDGRTVIRGHRAGASSRAAALGRELAEELLARGAADILAAAAPPSRD
jgi:hydroxymethylbilane synthase